jgi:HD-like signal output (HDOD) protein
VLSWLTGHKKKDPKKALHEALGAYSLPTFPAVAAAVLRMLRDPNAPLPATAERLAEDPGLTARVLGLANSSAYALRHPVRNVGHAVSLLGRSEVESLVLAVVVRQCLPAPDVEGFDNGRFWHSAARRAAAAGALAKALHPATESESFTASLLSDMAVPLIGQAQEKRYGEVWTAWTADGGDLAALERDALGFDHATVAGWVAASWGFPDRLTDAIGAHHEGRETEATPAAVMLVAPLGEGEEHGVDEVVETAKRRFGLASDQTAAILSQSFEQAAEIASRMG